MHERRNFVVVLLLVASALWCAFAWLFAGDGFASASGAVWAQRWVAAAAVVALGGFLAWAMLREDALPDHLRGVAGDVYFEVDGLCFMPVVRTGPQGRAELCVYYQNRFENAVNAVVHLRPPTDSFVIRDGMRDAHFAFRADGGAFGCLHQPIGVPRHLQGEVVHVDLAAASHYPHGHGACQRRRPGLHCGTLHVDWQGAAFKSGVHEVSGEIDLVRPSALHLSMPTGVKTRVEEETAWRQEHIAAGAAS